MAELDDIVGRLFGKLDGLGIAKSTIVLFTTDNGVEIFSWPDGGNIPFRGEKGTTWEGGFRVPAFVRWPGVIKPGPVVNAVMSHEDWLPTFLAAAGVPDINQQLLRGYKAGDKTFKNHLDGYNFMPSSRVKPLRPRVARSSISTTTPASTRCATTTGRSTSSGSRAISSLAL